ncbi:hypothetical protein C8R43DRAFT_1142885 [Mycena crocata]|nr:hypothetical protein C8R43DRAFT_1142885 [Mycena crocata]
MPANAYITTTALFYPWGVTGRHIVELVIHPEEDRSLGKTSAIQAILDPSPTECAICPKPHLSHPSVPDGTFTVLFACPHGYDDDESGPLYPNKSVAKLFQIDQPTRISTCMGNVLVVKHALSPGTPNRDMTMIDLLPSDFSAVDLLVKQYLHPL